MNSPPPTESTEKFHLKGISRILLAMLAVVVAALAIHFFATSEDHNQQFLITGLIVVGLALGLFEIRRLNQRLANLANVANELGQGLYESRAESEGRDAVALVGKSLNVMADRIATTVNDLERSHSELAKSQEKLSRQNLELSQAYERQSRFGEFLAKLNAIDVESIGREGFPDMLNAARGQVGVFFLFDEKTQQLNRLAEFGVDRTALRQIAPDNNFEGVPGEAFTRREWIVIEELDQDLLPELDLGFGKARLQTVYAIPLLFHNKALGVVMIGSVHPPSEANTLTLRNYSRALAHALNNALTHEAVQSQTREFESANERLLAMDTHRRQFVANMSHELRTPLNSIIGFSGVLSKNRDGVLTTGHLDRIEKINRNGKHLLQLINDILDLSKMEAGGMEAEFEPIQLAPVLEEVRDMLLPQADAKGIDLRLELPEADVICETDAVKIKQVVINLANNAVKFTENGSVSIKLIPPDVVCPGPAIEVRDTGIGISEDKLDTIFEAFRQADSTTSRKYGGTGLGLTISRNLLALLGGRVRVSSRVGQGSAFTVELPALSHSGRKMSPSEENGQHREVGETAGRPR